MIPVRKTQTFVRRLLQAALLLPAFLLAAHLQQAEAASSVRVRLAEAPEVVLRGALQFRGEDSKGRSSALKVGASGKNLRVNGSLELGKLAVGAVEGNIELNGNRYRGSFLLEAVAGKVRVVNIVDIDDYLSSVLAGEMSHAWPIEALKAQAVVSRSYVAVRAAASQGRGYDVDATTMSQVYRGQGGEHISTRLAVADTAGEVLSTGSGVVEAFFHSSCGGKTEAPEHIWTKAVNGISGVDDPWCETAPDYFWSHEVEARDLGRRLGLSAVTEVQILERSPGGRVRRVELAAGDKRIRLSGEELRAKLGYGKLKSTLFQVSTAKRAFVFQGSGSGHGVGMCQWGARGMAEKERGYRSILKHYFPNASLSQL